MCWFQHHIPKEAQADNRYNRPESLDAVFYYLAMLFPFAREHDKKKLNRHMFWICYFTFLENAIGHAY